MRRRHAKTLRECVMDLLRALATPNTDIRRRTLEVAMDLVSPRNVEEVMALLKKEIVATGSKQAATPTSGAGASSGGGRSEPEAVEYGPDGKPKKKARAEEAHSSDEEHGDFDPQQLREHEEFTKVRNVLSIELGKHTMDTWCAARRRHFAVPRAPPPRACPPRVRCRAQPVGSRLASRVVQVLQPVP